MLFKIPGAVASTIAPYDPALKVNAVKEKTIKSKNTLGLPTHLVPTDLVPAQTQAEWVNALNNRHSANRMLSISEPGYEVRIIHGNKRWLAVWILNRDYGKYLFGFSLTYKDTQHTRDYVEPDLKKYKLPDPTPMVNGRSKMLQISMEVGLDQLREWGIDYLPLFDADNCWRKTTHIQSLHEILKERHSQWGNGHYNVFNKIICAGDTRKVAFGIGSPDKPFTELFIETNNLDRTLFNKPFFRIELLGVESEYGEVLAETNKPDLAKTKVLNKFVAKSRTIQVLSSCYGNDPSLVDYAQTLWRKDIQISISKFWNPITRTHDYAYLDKTFAWIGVNVPIGSFVNMADSNILMLKDTIDMIRRIIDNGAEHVLVKPKRWRVQSWHDYLSSEVFKINTPNEKLPQDLFPEPVKAQGYTFFQPRDIHQLGQWGQAARNCVGSASSYAQGVKNKKHFIVLAMKDNTPHFTIQLKANGGMMEVMQIVGVCNKPLNDEEKASYSKAFAEALQIREQQLV